MSRTLVFSFLLCLCLASQAAQEHRHGEGHGQVSFPTTCKPEARAAFHRAVALLHSFGYEESRRGFVEVGRQDPACGMAWWGVAMTYFHQHWDQPTAEELAAGRAAAEKAARVGAKSEREKAFIAAIDVFYRDADRLDHTTRTRAYQAAMEKLAARFPADHEAAIFYALALLASRPAHDPTYANQRKAAEILNGLLSRHPEHPGIIHYIIHAFDYPELAKLALPAARTYAKVAPAVPHALHMPSHIFTRLGLWKESIASNLDVVRVAQAQVARSHPGAVAFEQLHGSDYLVYAYLQLGQDEKARQVREEVSKASRFDDPNFAAAYALASIPTRDALERGDWKTAADLSPPAVDLPWENFRYARSNTYYANAIGAARAGEPERARRALSELEKLRAELAAAPPRGPYDWAGKVEAMGLAAAGWVAYAEGREGEAVRLIRQAADLEEKVGKHPVTPGPILPAREQLGDLLLALRRPEEALAAYVAALENSPGRFRSIAGAAAAAEAAGDRERARQYHESLLGLCSPPGCGRPAARRAASFLGRN